MQTRRLPRYAGLVPAQGWRHTVVAALLWGGVTVFIFGIIANVIH